jgi:hypothetical protein
VLLLFRFISLLAIFPFLPFYVLEVISCFMGYRATWLFSDAHDEISTLPLGFFCTELFHEFVAFIYIYTIVITLFCVYMCQSCVLNMCMCAYIFPALVLVSDTHS